LPAALRLQSGHRRTIYGEKDSEDGRDRQDAEANDREKVMDLLEKLPELSDDALGNLRSNAMRLQTSGTANQRDNAAALLPAVEAEITARRRAKASRRPPAKPRAPRRVANKSAAIGSDS
jgi:hypothetical protein